MGVVEPLPFERVEGGADLFFISGGGTEDMVVERRPARGMRTSRLAFESPAHVRWGRGSPTWSRVITTTLSVMLSSVHRGAMFEKRAMRLLQGNLSMSLNRVGGKSDGGIDLQGWWWPPFTPSAFTDPTHRLRVRVFAQCKAEKKKIGPKYIREMEGALHPHFDDPKPMVALFISESHFTKEALLRMQSSSIPFFLLHLPPEHEDDIGSMVWNHALSGTSGLLQGKVEARWERSLDCDKTGRPSLWVQDQRAPSWTPEQPCVAVHPLYAHYFTLTVLRSDRHSSIMLNPVFRSDFEPWATVVYYMTYECNVNASTPFPRPR